MQDDGSERGPAQLTHPGALVGAREPDGESYGKDAYEGRDHAMAVLEEDSAGHLRHHLTVGERPVGHG